MAADLMLINHPSSTKVKSEPDLFPKLKELSHDTSTFTLAVDDQFFDSRPHLGTDPSTWSSSILKSMVPETDPNVRLFFASLGPSPSVQVVAAQFLLAEYDIIRATRVLQTHLAQWVEEYVQRILMSQPNSLSTDNRRTSTRTASSSNILPNMNTQYGVSSYSNSMITLPSRLKELTQLSTSPTIKPETSVSGSQPLTEQHTRPTLYSLIAKLGDSSVTTIEQRFAIRQIVTDFLNYDINQRKVYSYIAQVVGYRTLEAVMLSLDETIAPESKPLQKSPSLSTLKQFTETTTRSDAAPTSATRTSEIVKFTPYVLDTCNESKFSIPEIKDSVTYSLKWIATDLYWPFWNEKVFLHNQKCWFFGGAPKSFLSYPLPDSSEPSTFKVLRTIDTVTLNPENVTTSDLLENSPPSMLGHASHIGAFPSGRICIVHGGMVWGTNPEHKSSSMEELRLLNSKLYGYSLTENRWNVLDTNSAIRPCARYNHASALIPYSSELRKGTNSDTFAEFLIIFGGLGYVCNEKNKTDNINTEKLNILNDLWAFNFSTLQWSSVCTNPIFPDSRFGAEFIWVAEDTLLLYGGETSFEELKKSVDTHCCSEDHFKKQELNAYEFNDFEEDNSRVILNDSWFAYLFINYFSQEKAVVSTKNSSFELCDEKSDEGQETTKLKYPAEIFVYWAKQEVNSIKNIEMSPRAHYASLGLTMCLKENVETERSFQNNSKNKFLALVSSLQPHEHIMWLESVEACSEELDFEHWSTQRIVFIISGTTQTKDKFIFEIENVLLGIITTGKTISDKQMQGRITYAVHWTSIDSIPVVDLNKKEDVSVKFSGRRDHCALYFSTAPEKLSSSLSYSLCKTNNHETQKRILSSGNKFFQLLETQFKKKKKMILQKIKTLLQLQNLKLNMLKQKIKMKV